MVNDAPPTPPTPATPSSATLSISQLREKLKAFGVSYEHCIEKAELVKLLKRAEFKAGRVEFKPTHRWQTVESFHLCPMGLQYEMDMKSGTTFARLTEAGNGKSARTVPTTPPSRVSATTPSKAGVTPPSKVGATPPSKVGATPPSKIGGTPPCRWSKGLFGPSKFPAKSSSAPPTPASRILTKTSVLPVSSMRFTITTPLKLSGGTGHARSTSAQITESTLRKSETKKADGSNRCYRFFSGASSSHLPHTPPLARMQSEPDLTSSVSRKRILERAAVRPEREPKQPPVPSASSQSVVTPEPEHAPAVPPVLRDTSLYDELPFEDKEETERRRRRRQSLNGANSESPLNSSQDSRKRRRSRYGETTQDIPYLAPLHPEGPLDGVEQVEVDAKRQRVDVPAQVESMGPPLPPRDSKRTTLEGAESKRSIPELPKDPEVKRKKSNSPVRKEELATPLDQPDRTQEVGLQASAGKGESDDEQWPTSEEEGEEAHPSSSDKAQGRPIVTDVASRAQGERRSRAKKESDDERLRQSSAESEGGKRRERKREQRRDREGRDTRSAAKDRQRRRSSSGKESVDRRRKRRTKDGEERRRQPKAEKEEGEKRRQSRAGDECEGRRRRSRAQNECGERRQRSSSAEKERGKRGKRDTRRPSVEKERRVRRTVAKGEDRPRSVERDTSRQASVENEPSRHRKDGRRECRTGDRDRRKRRERRRSSRDHQRCRSASGSKLEQTDERRKGDVLPSDAPFDSYI